MRCGQHTCGGTNYWESPKALNEAIKRYVIAHWAKIYTDVFDDLKQREADALKDCQEYVDKMQKLINEA